MQLNEPQMGLFEVRKLISHPKQNEFFKPLSASEHNLFRADISERGIVQPIVLSGRSGGLTVCDGHQRVTVARELGLERIPGVLRHFADEREEVECLVLNNTRRRQMNRKEVDAVLSYWLKNFTDRSNNWIGKDLGIGKNKVEEKRSELEAGCLIDNLEALKGEDGKTYPRKQKAKTKAKAPAKPPAKSAPAPVAAREPEPAPEVERDAPPAEYLDEIIPAPISLVSPREIPNVMAYKLHKGVDAVLAVSDDDMRAFLQTGVTEHDRMIHKLTTLAAKLDRVLLPSQNAEPGSGEDTIWN
jgi:hypothetical protein